MIPSLGSVATTAASLLESHLGEAGGLRLISRAELQAALNEQLLTSALSATGTQSRLQLGKLVKADLLVFIKESGGERRQASRSLSPRRALVSD